MMGIGDLKIEESELEVLCTIFRALVLTSSLENVLCFIQQGGTFKTHNAVVVLQNCVGLLKVEPGLCSERTITAAHGENQVIGIKVEDDVGVEEVEDPLPIIDPATQAEHEVSLVLCPL
jgi:hypothetical protein